jgi:hypothetical protein
MGGERIDDRAFLPLIRKWLKAGSLETDGPVIHPETGTPPGGTVAPVRANVYLHEALALWFAKVVKAHGRGAALLGRAAEDGVCAFRYEEDAVRFSRVLPKRWAKFHRQVAPEKTRLLRCSRFHPGMPQRCTFRGFACSWKPERQGVPRGLRRTARQKLHAACRRSTAWMKQHRPLPGRALFQRLKARRRGHSNYYGVRGTARALHRFFNGAMPCPFTGRNRRGGKRRSVLWEPCTPLLDRVKRARPRIPEVRRRRVEA